VAKYVKEAEAVEPPARVSGTTLSPETIEQIAIALHAALQRAVQPAPVVPAAAPTVTMPKVGGLGTRSI
jgi:hypothetical protein